MTVRLRVAPSPTGDPHVGTAYMSMFDLAFARQQGGQFILRIEDTDQARFDPTSEQQIYDTLSWLGLSWDEGPDKGGPYAPYHQSQRLETYRPIAEQLVEQGNAYYCWCSTERLAEMREAQQKAKQPTGYDRLCHGKTRDERAAMPGFTETPVIRMLVPDDAPTSFVDRIRGEINAPKSDDGVILKADGFPTYHLAVVVDDHLMGITHVVRGNEWINSTPKHILLYRWLGWDMPEWIHMPLLLNIDKSKISKRKNPAARLTWFKEQGYLPEALVNFLALLGYSQPDEREIFTFEEMVRDFDWNRVNPSGAVFDVDKLNWLNGHYIRELSDDDFAQRVRPYLLAAGALSEPVSDEHLAMLAAASPLVKERVTTLAEAVPMLAFLFTDDDDFVPEHESAAKTLLGEAVPALDAAITALEELDTFAHADVEAALRAALIDGLGLKPKHAFAPIRVAVTGRNVSPPLFESMEILGRDSSLARLRAALLDIRGY